jgi:hypothetical protein
MNSFMQKTSNFRATPTMIFRTHYCSHMAFDKEKRSVDRQSGSYPTFFSCYFPAGAEGQAGPILALSVKACARQVYTNAVLRCLVLPGTPCDKKALA